MDDDTIQGVLAHMAYRVVDSRRRDLAETIALRLYRANGSVTADEVAAGLAAEWVEPDPAEVANLVARKAQAAVLFHQAEADAQAAQLANLQAKAAKLQAQADQAKATADHLAAELAAGNTAQADAQAVLDAAVAAGADPGLAPSGADAQARADVAAAVGEATSGQGA